MEFFDFSMVNDDWPLIYRRSRTTGGKFALVLVFAKNIEICQKTNRVGQQNHNTSLPTFMHIGKQKLHT